MRSFGDIIELSRDRRSFYLPTKSRRFASRPRSLDKNLAKRKMTALWLGVMSPKYMDWGSDDTIKETNKRARKALWEMQKKNRERDLKLYQKYLKQQAIKNGYETPIDKENPKVERFFGDSPRSCKAEHIPSSVRKYVWERDGGICQYCGDAAEAIDHIYPKSLGGKSVPSNLALACETCNSMLNNRVFANIDEKRAWIWSRRGIG